MNAHLRASDAGLLAVARVRKVRESDSKIGLQTALAEQREAQARVDVLRHQLESTDAFGTGSAAEFLAVRASLQAIGEVLLVAEEQRESTGTISAAAFARWQHDRARLAAIEMLLERRAAAHRAEIARAEATELDDIAAQRWLRQRSHATESPKTEVAR